MTAIDSKMIQTMNSDNLSDTKIVTTYEQLVSTNPNMRDTQTKKIRKAYGSKHEIQSNSNTMTKSSKSNDAELIMKEQKQLLRKIQMEFGENDKHELDIQTSDSVEDEDIIFDSSQTVISEDEINLNQSEQKKQNQLLEMGEKDHSEATLFDSSPIESMDSDKQIHLQKDIQSQDDNSPSVASSPTHISPQDEDHSTNQELKNLQSQESALVLDSSQMDRNDESNEETIVLDSSQMEFNEDKTQTTNDILTSLSNPTSSQENDNPSIMTSALFISSIDELYTKANKDTVTIGDIVRAMEAKFNVNLSKKKKRKIRARLTDLSTGRVKLSTTEEASHHSENESENEYERELSETAESDEDINNEWKDDTERRSKRLGSKKRKHNHRHLKKASDVIKKQKDMEKVIKEEMEAAAVQLKSSKEHLERMEKIRQKFETNSEEALQSRFEDRLGLLDKLKKKRMEVIELSDDDEDDQHENKDISPIKNVQENKNIIKEEGETDSNNSNNDKKSDTNKQTSTNTIADSEETDDELILVSSKPKINLAMTLLESTSLAKKKTKKVVNARLLLRKNLRQKTIHAGNAWLARELGYENEEDHILDCQRVEQKRRLFLKKQEESKRKLMEKKSRMFSDHIGDIDYETGELEFQEENKDEVEEDEELLLAKEVEAELSEAEVEHGEDVQSGDAEGEQEVMNDASDALETGNNTELNQTDNDNTILTKNNSEMDSSEMKKSDSTIDEMDLATQPISDQSFPDVKESNDESINATSSLDHKTNAGNDLNSKEKASKKRNVMWQSMLKKEAEAARKQKKSNWVETEADEEENDDAVMGLEDFGFTSIKKKDADDEDDEKLFEAKEEDLDIVVDELSDDEGDEEAGEAGRKALQAKEEKEKHREIMRRMRDGYDGRRGGIGGGVARGMHRFDQITAAGNRSDAKRLGLLNDDEIESDEEAELNEEDGEKQDVEDEHVLLDRMLKERVLKKKTEPSMFSDDEDEEDEETKNDDTDNVKEKEEQEEQRLANIFTKRARMNRLLSIYDDAEFSQERLNVSEDLKNVKCMFSKRRRQESCESTMTSKSSSTLENKSKILPTLTRSKSLSLSIGIKQHSKKRKTNFFNTNKEKTNKDNTFRPMQRAVTLSHVVFHNNANENVKKFSNQAPFSRSNSLSSSSISSNSTKMKRPTGGSLWSKVSQNRFRSH